MDLVIFLVGSFAAAFVAGLAGFAFGLVAAAIWLYALTPLQATILIAAYALLVQGYAVWKLRHAIRMHRLWPFLIGSAVGVPAGVALMERAAPGHLRPAVGALLIAFSLYNLIRPKLRPMKNAGPVADGSIGLLNGVLGGSTGLGGIIPAVWCGLRGWSRDEQRAVFQPTGVATFLLTLLWLGGSETISAKDVRLFLIGLPALALGTALGWHLYGKLDEERFRQVVLCLLLISGIALVAIVR